MILKLFISQIPPQELEPEFLAPLENMTVTQGRDISFTCVVNHLGQYKVAWIKSDSKAILAIHTHLVAHNSRLSVTHNGHNTWKLHVSNVQKNDSGTYMCQINTDPMRSQMGHLGVVVPPDILNDDTGDGNTAPEGGSVHLRCKATGVPKPTVMWRREDGRNIVLRHEGGREKQSMKSYDGETLLLSSIQRTDMGAYLCISTNGVPPSVSKRFIVQVHFHPLIKVSNQLVAAPVGSDVVIQCYVEASPRAMNSWLKDTGEKLLEGTKYVMEEAMLSDYALLMNLTIRNLEKRDFGGYVCSSVNALGKVEGGVRLQELHLAPKTTIVPDAERRDNKSRKKETTPSKERKKNNQRRTRPRKKEEESLEEDEGVETVTTGSWPEPRTVQTIIPSASRPPPWILRQNDVTSASATRLNCISLPLRVTLALVSVAGHGILGHHLSVQIKFGSHKEPPSICRLIVSKVKTAQLFWNIPPGCKPIAIKYHHQTATDTKFIAQGIQQLLNEDVIEESFSPWRAQVLVTQSESHKHHTVKSHVAPLKKTTISRLELLACSTGDCLASSIMASLGIGDLSTYYWMDSTTALCWIKRKEVWGTFVANRVKKIKQLLSPDTWNHVRGVNNLADLPSMGCSATKLLMLKWWEGPQWLRCPSSKWPVDDVNPDEEKVNEEKKKGLSTVLDSSKPEEKWHLQYFSKAFELIRTLSPPGFLQALRRLIAWRGGPNVIYSDDGRNFVGAKNAFCDLD
ncbi:uncharacterized protein [Anabrus simplex]|uniref:uncharacterized protein n=1 Tax=Anabrus simplex TaxID=316456 RepID=UPI0035A3CE16